MTGIILIEEEPMLEVFKKLIIWYLLIVLFLILCIKITDNFSDVDCNVDCNIKKDSKVIK